jgi:alpha-mannosidase
MHLRPVRQNSNFAFTSNMMKPSKIFFLCALLMLCDRAGADPLTNRLAHFNSDLVREFSVPIEGWRFCQPDVPDGERPDFDDSKWQNVSPGFSWSGAETSAWFRAKILIPATVMGQSAEGFPVRLDLGLSGRYELYIDGQLKSAFRGDGGLYTLTEHARPGQTFNVALRGIKGQRDGRFHYARLFVNVLPELGQYLDETTFADLLMDRLSADEQALVKKDLRASESEIHFAEVSPDNLDSVRAELAKARAALAPIAGITKKYDVYYIGHAHIDMNWQWTWAETIDVCHRTWNSAMNLMDEFPDFHYVQSQPAAYVPIEEEFPEEFARMQAMAARGQWDPVGGLWDESDTDIPSGEGLARSFLLGQRFFKSKFGKYAITGWLPDSFGHTWQLPQIMQLAGIQYFYHMRCGNGMEFTWWEAPDGSRVLKANTQSYDAKPKLDQLVMPMENESRFNLPQSVTVFGVGDHGGGPTREQILRVQSFQNDPIFPRIHFISADAFFEQLAKQPATASLPVVDSGLQYVFQGCYTTHADMKKELRRSENNLYSAEVLSSLAALMGQPYPVDGFDDAWKPTAFAQFHDIACGSAIHSTYDWMHQQMAPALRFEQEQTDKSLHFLTANADTRGPGTNAIVVWNTLSFARDDVVKIPLADAEQYHSVSDSQGRHFPAQTLDGGTLVFVARDVPAFGHTVYFPETNSCPADGAVLQDIDDVYEVQTPSLTLQVNKTTGAIGELYSKTAKWNVFGNGPDADAWQLLGDSGSSWTIHYTGSDQILTTEGAKVSVLDQGPVFDRVRVTHAFGHSTYTQDLTVYGALPRVDIPTTVDWQEEHELLKIRLPVNATNLEANAQIPFGSTVRPTAEQECPGQKWMDVSEMAPTPVEHAMPLDFSSVFNANCTKDFDGDGNSYAAELLSAAGIHQLGPDQVPFNLAFDPGQSNRDDSVIAAGQELQLPVGASGSTLYLLGACAKGNQKTDIGFRLADGATEFRPFDLNDWEGENRADNEIGLSFPYRQTSGGRHFAPPKMWIVQVPMPKGATGLILPRNAKVHLFAATIATKPAQALRGLSVLNDCKYGFDVSSNVFRLTALRSAPRPDPHPDQGMQTFTYSLYPHAGDWRAAHTDQQALGLNIPLLATVTQPHPPAGGIPSFSVVNVGDKGDLIVTAMKHSEDGDGFILRFYEADGQDTQARIDFDRAFQVNETDLLERPLAKHPLTIQGNSVSLPVGHNQIITLHVLFDSQ